MAPEIPQEDIDKLLSAITPRNNKQKPLIEHPVSPDILTINEDLQGELIHDGTVIIRGRAFPGSRIEVTGNITVTGGVTGGEIIAGQGIITPFFEMSSVICQGDLLVTSHLLNCTVCCGGGIYCSAGSTIRGGNYSAYYTIQADYIGHPFEINTKLELIKSNSNLTNSFNPELKGDPYLYNLVALKKVWPETIMGIYGHFYSPVEKIDGPFIVDSSMIGGLY